MSTLTLDLTTIEDQVLAEELKRRIKAKTVSLWSLGFMPTLSDIDGDDLIAEVNKRIDAETIDWEKIEIQPETGGGIREEDEALEAIEIGALDEAAIRFARRDYGETLWNLEKALGPAFAGLGDLKVASN